MTKVCKVCKKNLEINNFHKDLQKKFGVKNICKNCLKKNKRAVFPNRKIDRNLSSSIRRSLKNNKILYCEKIVGYDLNILKNEIEKKFHSGMNWKNYCKVWKLKKIIPSSFYRYSNSYTNSYNNSYNNELVKSWNYKNFKPVLIGKEKININEEIKKNNLYSILPIGNLNNLVEINIDKK